MQQNCLNVKFIFEHIFCAHNFCFFVSNFMAQKRWNKNSCSTKFMGEPNTNKNEQQKKAKMSLSTISTRYDHKLNTERTNGDKYGENAKKRQSYASRIMTRWHSELSKEKFIIQLFHCYLSRNFITSNRFIHRLTQFYFASSLLWFLL